jgi:hypothetical protein
MKHRLALAALLPLTATAAHAQQVPPYVYPISLGTANPSGCTLNYLDQVQDLILALLFCQRRFVG